VIAPPPPPLPTAAARSGPPGIQQGILVGIALAPLALLLFLALAAPGFLDPLADQSVAVAGLPLGWLIVGLFAALTAMAVVVALTVRSAIGAGLFVVVAAGFALWLVILGPAIVLIASGLGTT
jgi:hypothetical protein